MRPPSTPHHCWLLCHFPRCDFGTLCCVSFLAKNQEFSYLFSYHHPYLLSPRHDWFFWRFFPTICPTILHFGRIFWSGFWSVFFAYHLRLVIYWFPLETFVSNLLSLANYLTRHQQPAHWFSPGFPLWFPLENFSQVETSVETLRPLARAVRTCPFRVLHPAPSGNH